MPASLLILMLSLQILMLPPSPRPLSSDHLQGNGKISDSEATAADIVSDVPIFQIFVVLQKHTPP